MLSSQLQIVQQAKTFLQEVSLEAYQAVASPHFSASAGQHMRHILDHYLALKAGLESGCIDYNKRNRASDIETDPNAALQQWCGIEHWLAAISERDGALPVQVISEVSLQQQRSLSATSSLARELVFVASHAIHHFSLLAISQSLMGEQTMLNFGLAPATLSYQRQQG